MMIVSEIVAPFLLHLTIKTVFLILHYFIELTTHGRLTILKNIIYKIRLSWQWQRNTPCPHHHNKQKVLH